MHSEFKYWLKQQTYQFMGHMNMWVIIPTYKTSTNYSWSNILARRKIIDRARRNKHKSKF